MDKSILVVDDSITIRKIVISMLEGMREARGFKFIEASDAVIAENIVRKQSDDIVLILTDIQMPEVDGIEFITRLKHANFLDDKMVVFMTSSASLENVQKAKKLGANHFIKKPLNEKMFYNHMGPVLNNLNTRKSNMALHSILEFCNDNNDAMIIDGKFRIRNGSKILEIPMHLLEYNGIQIVKDFGA
jgi:CheY-like chemotaxis protein